MKLLTYIQQLRPTQWLKNLMLFFPPFLGGAVLSPGIFLKGIAPFAAFCCASSVMYVFNDISDVDSDRLHDVKRHRPIASGAIRPSSAYLLVIVFAIAALSLSLTISGVFIWYLLLYCAVSAGYSIFLKHLPIVDLFCISSGFIIRLLAGGEAFGIVVSEWLFLSVFLLSLFLSTGKRSSEKKKLGERAGDHRKSLSSYPDGFLEGAMFMTGSAVLVTYTMYVVNRHSLILIYTVPLCCFGLMRYAFRVQSGQGGDPTESLTRDVPLLLVSLVWAVMVGWGVYG